MSLKVSLSHFQPIVETLQNYTLRGVWNIQWKCRWKVDDVMSHCLSWSIVSNSWKDCTVFSLVLSLSRPHLPSVSFKRDQLCGKHRFGFYQDVYTACLLCCFETELNEKISLFSSRNRPSSFFSGKLTSHCVINDQSYLFSKINRS